VRAYIKELLPDVLDGRISAAGRAGTPDEVGNVGALLMGSDGAFITGNDFLMDGGVTAAYLFGELASK
jgi:NAD(P)-dependent dehydrogenase (short-subunit alcohol dehydrogenase family)